MGIFNLQGPLAVFVCQSAIYRSGVCAKFRVWYTTVGLEHFQLVFMLGCSIYRCAKFRKVGLSRNNVKSIICLCENSPRALSTPYYAQFLLIKVFCKMVPLPGLLAKYCNFKTFMCQLSADWQCKWPVSNSLFPPTFSHHYMCSPSLLSISAIDQCRECERAHSVLWCESHISEVEGRTWWCGGGERWGEE